jgi:acetyl-CoA C-acetyltransferase
MMLTGPVDVTEKLAERSGMKMSDIDLFELNEGLCLGGAALHAGVQHPARKINVNGGAIAMGHPSARPAR